MADGPSVGLPDPTLAGLVRETLHSLVSVSELHRDHADVTVPHEYLIRWQRQMEALLRRLEEY
jgi:hypothetical protein